jgi:hypothetical protein
MNLITLIGAAVGSQIICELLFENPVEAARLLGFALTETELCAVRAVFKEENRNPISGHLNGVRAFMCKKSPCPYAIAVPGYDVSCRETAENAVA